MKPAFVDSLTHHLFLSYLFSLNFNAFILLYFFSLPVFISFFGLDSSIFSVEHWRLTLPHAALSALMQLLYCFHNTLLGKKHLEILRFSLVLDYLNKSIFCLMGVWEKIVWRIQFVGLRVERKLKQDDDENQECELSIDFVFLNVVFIHFLDSKVALNYIWHIVTY